MNFKKYHLQSNNLGKIVFVKRSWPNDSRIGCKSFFNSIELIEIDAELEKLQEFEPIFERDEIFKIQFIIEKIV